MVEVAATSLQAAPALVPGNTALAAGAVLEVLPPRTIVRLQLARSAIAHAQDLSVGATPLPTSPGACGGEDPALLWLGPDSWLIVSEQLDATTLVEQARLGCQQYTAAAVDVSDSLVAFRLEGPRVKALLSRGTGLDVSDSAFPPGRCARTRLAQLPVILRSVARERVELLVDRGPAAWLHSWFADAGELL